MEGLYLPICSLFFSILLCVIYFSKKRIDLLENKVYSVMLISSVIDSILVTILQIIPLAILIYIYSFSIPSLF